PRFDVPEPLRVDLPAGHRWVQEADFQGPLAVVGRARARFGAAVAHFDADGDGRLDLYLAAAVLGPKGVRDVLLLNRGEGRFEDATLAFGLPEDRASLGVAAGDFDADQYIDLFLTGVGDNRLYRNLKGQRFEDLTRALGDPGPAAISPTARWLDLDQDGDLDLIVLNYTAAEKAEQAFHEEAPAGLPNVAYRNDGKARPIGNRPPGNWAPLAVAPEDLGASEGLEIAFTPWTGLEVEALRAGDQPHTGIAALDLDDDRDVDLIFSVDGAAPLAVLNDRLGRFHAERLDDLRSDEPGSGLLVTNLDRDGRPDLVALYARGRAAAWRNARKDRDGGKPGFAFAFWPTDLRRWRSAQAADLDLDGRADLVGLPAFDDAEAAVWARNAGNRLATAALALGPDEPKPLQGLDLADLVGDPLPDLLLVRDGEGPRVAKNRGNGGHWLALDLSGRWKQGPQGGPMRTNPHGLGVRIALEGQGLYVPYDHTTPATGPAQSVGPVVLGLGPYPSAPLIHLRWPDGVIQCELNTPADQALALAENCRKTGSCPVLFTFDGERFICLGDFLGGGGLGYLVAPGVYSQPDRDEAVAIASDQLREVGGAYRLSITEPMDEVAYLDHLALDVIDRPPGVSTAPDERFAPVGPRPTGALIAWRRAIQPERATDLEGRDVSELLRAWDRRTQA
ncbi:MAG: CRTAC1 family protein, partial [Isosphaeraceae bacterium]|nr:CRTAC1 family protein [Isosphaeraceae bacterium]